MQFSVSRGSLYLACQLTRGVGVSRNTIPILDNVLLEAGRDTLTVTANNMDMAVAVTVPAVVTEKGEATANAARLNDLATVAHEGSDIAFKLADEGRLKVKAGRSNYTLATLPAGDFPMFKVEMDDAISFNLRGSEIEHLFAVNYAVSDNPDRPYLNGVFLHRHKDALKAVATNTFNLAVTEVPLPEGAELMDCIDEPGHESDGIIVTPQTIKILDQIISDGEVLFSFNKRRLEVTVDRDSVSIKLMSKLLDATYPTYRRIIPEFKDLVGTSVINTAVLEAAIRRVSIVTHEKNNFVNMVFKDNTLSIDARDKSLGEDAIDVIDIEWSHPETKVTFNVKPLLASLKGLDSKELTFAIGEINSQRPSRFQCSGDEGRIDLVSPSKP